MKQMRSMIDKNGIIFFLLAFSLLCKAQKISINFPDNKNKEYTIIGYEGSQSDVLAYGKTDTNGVAFLHIPDSYRGIVRLHFLDAKGLDMIISDEDFSITKSGENLYFSDKENNQMIDFYSRAIALGDLNENSYAKSIISIYSFLEEFASVEGEASIRTLKKRLINNLNIDHLYNSGLWDELLSTFPELYIEDSDDFSVMIEQILKRSTNQVPMNYFLKNTILICEKYGWTKSESAILECYSQLVLDNELAVEKDMAKFYNLSLLKVGSSAPQLYTLGFSDKRTILFFYESSCGYCEKAVTVLADRYKSLQRRGIDVISISADTNRDVYKNIADYFPWEKKLCDYLGFDCDLFRVYGILGTPTFYLISEEGRIEGRYVSVEDIPIE